MTKASAGYFFLRPAIQASHCVRLRQLSWAYLDCLGPRTTPSNQLPGSHVALVVKSRHLCSAACPEALPGRRPLALVPGQRPGAPIKGAPGGGQAGAEAGQRWRGWRGCNTRMSTALLAERGGADLTRTNQGGASRTAHTRMSTALLAERGGADLTRTNQGGASRTAHTRMSTALLAERGGAH